MCACVYCVCVCVYIFFKLDSHSEERSLGYEKPTELKRPDRTVDLCVPSPSHSGARLH